MRPGPITGFFSSEGVSQVKTMNRQQDSCYNRIFSKVHIFLFFCFYCLSPFLSQRKCYLQVANLSMPIFSVFVRIICVI